LYNRVEDGKPERTESETGTGDKKSSSRRMGEKVVEERLMVILLVEKV